MSGGLSIVLIATDEGLILIDSALPQTVERVNANIAGLGFRIEDVRLILNTEAHFDHSGGLAALARDSGVIVLAGPDAATASHSTQTIGMSACGRPAAWRRLTYRAGRQSSLLAAPLLAAAVNAEVGTGGLG